MQSLYKINKDIQYTDLTWSKKLNRDDNKIYIEVNSKFNIDDVYYNTEKLLVELQQNINDCIIDFMRKNSK